MARRGQSSITGLVPFTDFAWTPNKAVMASHERNVTRRLEIPYLVEGSPDPGAKADTPPVLLPPPGRLLIPQVTVVLSSRYCILLGLK